MSSLRSRERPLPREILGVFNFGDAPREARFPRLELLLLGAGLRLDLPVDFLEVLEDFLVAMRIV